MTVKDGVRNVLRERGTLVIDSPCDHGDSRDGFVVEEQDDGSAAVRFAAAAAAGFTSGTLHRCADLFADAGFLVALLKDDRGVYISVS